MAQLGELVASRELLLNLTGRELKGKYNRSVLGWTWSLVNPLATMAIFLVVFRLFLKVPVPEGEPSGLQNFAFYLLCGLLAWNMFSNGLSTGMGSLLANGNLIKKVYFPREVLVLSTVLSWLVSGAVEFSVLAITLLIAGNFVLPWLPLVIVLLLIQTLMVFGVALVLSVVNVYFRDVQHLLGIALQLWFYATPIVYPLSLVPNRAELWGMSVPVRSIYDLNPMVKLVEAYRDALYDLRFPPAADVAYILVFTGLCLVIGFAVFRKLEPRLAEEL
jgi:lipopolysaccharide transport system permease protein